MSIKIEQFKAKNQFTLTTENGVYFESYGSVIVFKPNNGKNHCKNENYMYAILSSFAAGVCSAVVIAMILISNYKY